MADELKCCPFCGKVQQPEFYDRGERSSYWYVSCNGDDGDHQVRAVGDTEAEAIAAWNHRIEPEAADRGVSEAAIAEVIHDAMVWAAKQGGQPRRWCNGNSIAEGHARQAAAAIQSLRSERGGGQ